MANEAPVQRGNIPLAELERIGKALNLRVPNAGTCRICGKGPVNLGPDYVTPILWQHGGALMVGGNTYPSVVAVCDACGNMQYYNLVTMGVIVPPSAPNG